MATVSSNLEIAALFLLPLAVTIMEITNIIKQATRVLTKIRSFLLRFFNQSDRPRKTPVQNLGENIIPILKPKLKKKLPILGKKW